MKFEEFWEKYMEAKNITQVADLVIETFSQPLPENIAEEYDLGEIVTEFSGHHADIKAFEKVEEFAVVLREHQPELYKLEGHWLENTLIDYYCFKKDSEKIKTTIEHIVHINYDYDMLLLDLWSVFLCAIEEAPHIVEYAIEQIYEDIKNSSNLISGAERDLDIFMFHIEKEKHWQDGDWQQFAKAVSNYQFNLDEEFVEQLQKGWSATIDEGEQLLGDLPEDSRHRAYALGALRMLFIKNALKKDVPVRISSAIWETYEAYFYKNEGRSRTWSGYYTFEKKSLFKFLNNQQGFIMDRSTVVAMLIWGANYSLDFFKALGLTEGRQFEQQQELLRTIRDDFKKVNAYFLWEYTFVHDWKPADSMDSQLWEEEREEFVASFEMEQKPQFSQKSIFHDTFTDDISLPPPPPPSKPVRTSKKYGRNEKVTVQYTDGTIKKNIKYKHVLQDIEKGECEIIS